MRGRDDAVIDRVAQRHIARIPSLPDEAAAEIAHRGESQPRE